MLRDWKPNPPIRSLEQFAKLYKCSWLPNSREERVSTAYRALVAAQQGSRELYLRERMKLQRFGWTLTELGYGDLARPLDIDVWRLTESDGEKEVPELWRIDCHCLCDWYDLLEEHLPKRARALAYEVEESAWNVIRPGFCPGDREGKTMWLWRREMDERRILASSWEPSEFMVMMDYRIRKSFTTGTRKHPLINVLIDCDPYVKGAYQKYFATSERRLIKGAIGQSSQTPMETSRPRTALRV